MKANIFVAQRALSERLWRTPWCVTADSGCLIASAHQLAPIPKRQTRNLRTFMGYPVIFIRETAMTKCETQFAKRRTLERNGQEALFK
jgi:hypothetical protein